MDTDLAFRALALSLGVGLLLTVIAHKFDFPTIVLLFVGGLALGPAGLGWVQPESLGEVLPVVVSLSIGIILFEGGLTLNPRDYLASPRIIKLLLTVGALITWFCAALAVWWVFQASWQISLLAGSLVIVTGPTVIVPLLHRLNLQPRIGSILHWEGVLIDAVGVFIAVFCYELVVLGGGATAVTGLLLRLAVGLALGVAGGFAIQRCLERSWIPERLTNPFALASAVLIFASSELISHESGLLAVTVAGVIVGRRSSSEVRQIQAFKAELTDLLIGTLFLLLVSRLDPALFLDDIWLLAGSVAIVMFVGRPLNILLCSIGSGLSGREKLFLAWVAPRGIVAASMASLFALQLSGMPEHAAEAPLLEKFVYTTICATVVLQGLSAGWWARRLGVARGAKEGWLLVGAHRFGRELAKALRQRKIEVLLVDTNQRLVEAAQSEGLQAVLEDARDAEALRDDERFQSVGKVMALTDNVDLNELVAARWRPFLGRGNLFAWAPSAARHSTALVQSVFEDLPQPSKVSEELRNGQARLTLSEASPAEGAIPLLLWNESTFEPLKREDGPGEGLVLRLERQRSSLERATERGGVFRLKAQTLEEAYLNLCDEALSKEPQLNRELLIEDLQSLGRRRAPVFGEGVSAQHVYSPAIERSMCLLACLKEPLPSRSQRKAVQYAFLLISPSEDPEEPLSMLSEVVHLCHDRPALDAWAKTQAVSDSL